MRQQGKGKRVRVKKRDMGGKVDGRWKEVERGGRRMVGLEGAADGGGGG